VSFTTLLMCQPFHVFNCLSSERSLFRRGVFRNGWLLAAVTLSLTLHAGVLYLEVLQRASDTVTLGPRDRRVATGVAASVVVSSELLKASRWLPPGWRSAPPSPSASR